MYDPLIGRFVTADQVIPNLTDPTSGKVYDPQALNRYTYVRNNPIKYIDPSGNDFGYSGPGSERFFTPDFYKRQMAFWTSDKGKQVRDGIGLIGLGVAIGVGTYFGGPEVPSIVQSLLQFGGMCQASWGLTKVVSGLVGGEQPYKGVLDALIKEAAREKDKKLLQDLNTIATMPTKGGKTLIENATIALETGKIIQESYEIIENYIEQRKENSSNKKEKFIKKNESN